MILGELLLGLVATGIDFLFGIIFAIALVYVFICVFPFCRKRECLWTFILAAPALFPFNIELYLTFRYPNFFEDYPKIFCLFEGGRRNMHIVMCWNVGINVDFKNNLEKTISVWKMIHEKRGKVSVTTFETVWNILSVSMNNMFTLALARNIINNI